MGREAIGRAEASAQADVGMLANPTRNQFSHAEPLRCTCVDTSKALNVATQSNSRQSLQGEGWDDSRGNME